MNRRLLAELGLACVIGFVLLVIVQSLATALDAAGLEAAAALRTPGVTRTMQAISWLGSGDAQFPFAFGLAGFFLWRRRKRQAAQYLGWGFAGWAVWALLKILIHRARPRLVEHLSGAGWWSFPSGHAMLAPIVYVFAVVLLEPEIRNKTAWRILLAVSWVLSVLIAFSRVYLGVHYPTDVIAGLLAGSAWLALSTAMTRDEYKAPSDQ